MKKKLIALIMAIAMMATLSISALANEVDESGVKPITGKSDVETPIISVVIPTTLDFAFDAFNVQKSNATYSSMPNQIYAEDFELINKSEVPMAVVFYLNIKTANNAVVLDVDDDDINVASLSSVKKNMSFAIMGANAITNNTGSDLTTFASKAFATHTSVTYDTASASTLATFTSQNATEASMGFVLDRAVLDEDAVAGVGTLSSAIASAASLAAFNFFGNLNASAPWSNGDVTVGGVYWLTPVTARGYDEITGSNARGHNVINPDFTPKFNEIPVTAPIANVIALTTTTSTNRQQFEIARSVYEADGLKILLPSSVTGIATYTTGSSTFAAAEYSFDDATKVLTVKRVPAVNGPLDVTITTTGGANVIYYLSMTITT